MLGRAAASYSTSHLNLTANVLPGCIMTEDNEGVDNLQVSMDHGQTVLNKQPESVKIKTISTEEKVTVNGSHRTNGVVSCDKVTVNGNHGVVSCDKDMCTDKVTVSRTNSVVSCDENKRNDKLAVSRTNSVVSGDGSLTQIYPSDVTYCDVENSVTCCEPESQVFLVVIKLACCLIAGIFFGWCLEKSRVFEPASIRLQMVFKRWIMLKMFLAACASGQVVMSVLSLLPQTKQIFEESVSAFGQCFREKKGLLSSTTGPFILGAGMTLSGACPGMVLAQVGSWAKNAVFTLLGAMIGAFTYGLLAKHVEKLIKPKKPFHVHTVYEKFSLKYSVIALPMALLLLITIILMEVFIPWQQDLDYYNQNSFDIHRRNTSRITTSIFAMKSWPPSVSGAIIGLLQVAVICCVTDTLGSSSSYVTIVSQWVVTKKLQQKFTYFASARTGLGNWWQVVYVSGAVLGSLFSALSSNSLASTKGPNIVTAIFGGVFMLLGSRLASGCTSGHGLSGMGLLFWMSLIAVPCMFAGGIAVAFAMQAAGALEDYECHSDFTWMCETV